ncbi:MAG TPA: peptidoglycan DD-metalloendopeptidase family protein [Xanthomonadaceae bacterium]|nr:peptidoglycan DD-metalloendopeptidase family protein [Xanthomonadaceae bacterium]
MHTRRILLLSLLVLAGCASAPAPVHDRSPGVPRSARAVDDTHLVQRGDTIYGIAFRNNLDWREFAAWNQVGSPYTIYIGQRLRLTPPPGWRPGAVPAVAARSPDIVASTGPVETQPLVIDDRPARVEALGPATDTPRTTQPRPQPAETQAPTRPAPTPDRSAEARTPSVDPPPTPSATTPQGPPAATRTVQGVAWRWPASGPLLRTFAANDPLRQGIDIAGTAGDPVYASADGEVVYSGSGLVGYGELIIIKHSEQYLSAYGHNRRRLVSEGQRVRAGQQIAEMGRTGTDREKLHFEIRRGGRPVNPAEHLPPR